MGALTSLFGGGQKPTTTVQPLPPSRNDAEIARQVELENKRRRTMIGRQSQNPTGDTGDTSAATVGKTMLGGQRQATGA